MSFGFEFLGDKGVVISSNANAYSCILSTTVAGAFNIVGRREDDIIAYTKLGGGYGGLCEIPKNKTQLRFFSFQQSRLLVFRLQSKIPNIRNSNYGLEVLGSGGELIFSSNFYPLKASTDSTAYHALTYQTNFVSYITMNWEYFGYEYDIDAKWITPKGARGFREYRSGHFDTPIMPEAPSLNLAPMEYWSYQSIASNSGSAIDISDIPLSYSLNLASIGPR